MVRAMSNTYKSIVGLRAIRSYRDEAVTEDDLARILEAARWTGSSKNQQNWSIVVARGDLKEQLSGCGDFTTPLRNAPVALALIQEPGGYEFDTGRMAQNIMLGADAIGVASCPITLHREEDAAAALGLEGDRRCRYAIALGYPGTEAGPARFGGRKPIDEVVVDGSR